MPVSGSIGLPIGGRDANWDGGAARARVVDFYTKNGTTNWSQVKRAFFWIVPGKENLKTGYRLGFADIVDGKLVALPHGLFAVAGGHGVQGTTGIPPAAKAAIKRKVNTYYRKMKAKFPNDDFDFASPFPEVKNVETGEYEVVETIEELKHMETPDVDQFIDEGPLPESAEGLFKELTEKFFPVMGNATSFADLAGVEAVRQAIQKAFKTVYDFEMLAHSIARSSDTPGELVSGLKSLAEEMSEIFSKMSFDKDGNVVEKKDQDQPQDLALTAFINSDDQQDWEIKQKGSTALLKNSKGEQFFYGRFTNNLWDREDEVFITEAHKEFVNYLDSHPDEAPELWDWHEEDTAKTHRAVWWDFADGFLHAIWPVTSKEAQGIESFLEEFDPGMSHGFKVLERKSNDRRQISKYRTKEASILPLEFAANLGTTFNLLDQLEMMTPEEKQKMFTPEKQRALELLSLGEYTAPLGKSSEDDAAALDEAGGKRKQHEPNTKKEGNTMSDATDTPTTDQPRPEKDAPNVPETPAAIPAAAAPPPGIEETLEALQASTVEGFNLIMGQLKEIAGQVQSNTAALKGIKEKKGESPSVAAWVAAQKAGTSIGHSEGGDGEDGDKGGAGSGRKPRNGQVPDNDPLLGTGPEETAYDVEGHLLATY